MQWYRKSRHQKENSVHLGCKKQHSMNLSIREVSLETHEKRKKINSQKN